MFNCGAVDVVAQRCYCHHIADVVFTSCFCRPLRRRRRRGAFFIFSLSCVLLCRQLPTIFFVCAGASTLCVDVSVPVHIIEDKDEVENT